MQMGLLVQSNNSLSEQLQELNKQYNDLKINNYKEMIRIRPGLPETELDKHKKGIIERREEMNSVRDKMEVIEKELRIKQEELMKLQEEFNSCNADMQKAIQEL